MAFAITQTCCNDASCVSVCPVNCIHPTPQERAFGSTDILHIDPQTCIDCGACADACPVDAIFPVDRLGEADRVYADLNADYYADAVEERTWDPPSFPRGWPADVGPVRVAVVGTGPAAGYAARSLLLTTPAEVTMIDRLPTAGGLLRSGVAPDHPSTRKVAHSFSWVHRHPRTRMVMNVEVGRDLTHEDLLAHHHAVVYAVGAAEDKPLGVAGEEHVVSATRLVTWYNAHPDSADLPVDLGTTRAVVVGNGNVAVDVARILLGDPDELALTDIADHALEALRGSAVREVVLLGRRGPANAAYSGAELRALRAAPGIEVVVEDVTGVAETIADAAPGSPAALLQGLPVVRTADAPPDPDAPRRVVLHFHALTEHVGPDDVTVRDLDGADRTLGTRLVVRATGSRGAPVPGLPFDEVRGVVPHEAGAVVDPATGRRLPGTYVVGWIKRGSTGGIGANRVCAQETVATLRADATAGVLPRPPRSASAFARLLRSRVPQALGYRQMRAIDQAEIARGKAAGRPRVKFARREELLSAAGRRFTSGG